MLDPRQRAAILKKQAANAVEPRLEEAAVTHAQPALPFVALSLRQASELLGTDMTRVEELLDFGEIVAADSERSTVALDELTSFLFMARRDFARHDFHYSSVTPGRGVRVG